MTGTFTNQVLIDQILSPKGQHLLQDFPNLVRGEPGKEVPPQNWFDCSRSLSLLGIKPRHESETA